MTSKNPEMAIVPPGGGWKFIQQLPNGNYKHFVGLSEADLAQKIREFRQNNGIDVGNIYDEIRRGVSNIVSQVKPVTIKLADQRTLRERVTGWKTNRQFAKLELVDDTVANDRANVCINCPFNKINYYDDCIECYAHTNKDLYAMRQGKEANGSDWLGACEICGQDNKTAVFLSEKNLLHRNNFLDELESKRPACWLLHLDKEQHTEVE